MVTQALGFTGIRTEAETPYLNQENEHSPCLSGNRMPLRRSPKHSRPAEEKSKNLFRIPLYAKSKSCKD